MEDVKLQMYKKMFEEQHNDLKQGSVNIDNAVFNESLSNKTTEELMFMLTPEQRESIRYTIISKIKRLEQNELR
jgi:hypothetical protein